MRAAFAYASNGYALFPRYILLFLSGVGKTLYLDYGFLLPSREWGKYCNLLTRAVLHPWAKAPEELSEPGRHFLRLLVRNDLIRGAVDQRHGRILGINAGRAARVFPQPRLAAVDSVVAGL